MACCKCCCGNKNCDEGEIGKCCCGGPTGACCNTSQYCCDGVCEPAPCTGACCDGVFPCTQTTFEDCPFGFKGLGVACDPDPCLCVFYFDCLCSVNSGWTQGGEEACCPPLTFYNAADGVCDCIDPEDCPYGAGFATPSEIGEIVQCCPDGSCLAALEDCPP